MEDKNEVSVSEEADGEETCIGGRGIGDGEGRKEAAPYSTEDNHSWLLIRSADVQL